MIDKLIEFKKKSNTFNVLERQQVLLKNYMHREKLITEKGGRDAPRQKCFQEI